MSGAYFFGTRTIAYRLTGGGNSLGISWNHCDGVNDDEEEEEKEDREEEEDDDDMEKDVPICEKGWVFVIIKPFLG